MSIGGLGWLGNMGADEEDDNGASNRLLPVVDKNEEQLKEKEKAK